MKEIQDFESASYIFARCLIALLQDDVGMIVKDINDQHRVVYKKGTFINVSEETFPDIPEGTQIKVTHGDPTEEKNV